jgi:hypothetical protein
MRAIVNLITKALIDDTIDEVGGPAARRSFEKQLEDISAYLDSNGQLKVAAETKNKPRLSSYHKFCIDRNLFLNFDFGYYYDKHSIVDSFFPTFIDSVSKATNSRSGSMSDKIYFSFQVFNQVLESYTTARMSFFEALTKKYDTLDKRVSYTYTLDYTRHGHKYGILKSVFCDLYNCLDKIGHLVYYYFTEYNPTVSKDIYFSWLLNDDFKVVVEKNNNFQLLALRNLAVDFEEGYQYSYLRKLRNRITHSFLNINSGIAYNEKFSTYEITEAMLIEAVDELFLILKSALMYSVIAISSTKPDEIIMPMVATQEKQIFF